MTIDFNAATIAGHVRSGSLSAVAVAQEALRRINASDSLLAVTRCLADRALHEAATVDAKIARGEDPGALAGVPYAVKDLFDVAGLPTTAGAARLEFADPAPADAVAIARLQAAGAVLVATLNMDEFAYGFVTDNARWGITRNPHDRACFAGGSSGGSAAAVAGGLVSFALGSDTNGSIRIPAGLCGVFGIKPTHGALPMTGVYPFVDTFDDIGFFTRTARDLALIDAVVRDHAAPVTGAAKAAVLGGWFAQNLTAEMRDALAELTDALAPLPVVDVAGVAQARSAAFLITAYEGGTLHAPALRQDALSYDPATRDRLIAGAALPAALHAEALAVRDRFAVQFQALFDRFDVLIAPVAMGPAPRIDHPVVIIDGEEKPARANLGLLTQPISFLGLPVVTVPLAVPGMPLGVQLIGAKGSDHRLMAYAADLERKGIVRCILAEAF
jgi:AtzE family amidohydrolase